jgi:hypothetical protein
LRFSRQLVFWVVASCSLVEIYQGFRGQTTRRYNPEDSHLQIKTDRHQCISLYNHITIWQSP